MNIEKSALFHVDPDGKETPSTDILLGDDLGYAIAKALGLPDHLTKLELTFEGRGKMTVSYECFVLDDRPPLHEIPKMFASFKLVPAGEARLVPAGELLKDEIT